MKCRRAFCSTARPGPVFPRRLVAFGSSLVHCPNRPRAQSGRGQSFNNAPVNRFSRSPFSGRQSHWALAPPTPPSAGPHSSDAVPFSLPEELRALMRLLAHSVVVCTSTAPAVGSRPAAPRAMTMSSFTSLALRPVPAVTFNIATPSRTFDAVKASRRFNIHILSDGPMGAEVADWFTRGNEAGAGVFDGLAGCGAELVDLASGPEARQDAATEPPVLRSEGVLYVLRCKLLDEPSGGLVRVRDHVIVLGEVLEIKQGSRKVGDGGQDDRFGLIYADRRYRQLGGTLEKTGGEDLRLTAKPKHRG